MSRTPHNLGSKSGLLSNGSPIFAITHAVIQASEQYLKGGRWSAHEKVVYWAGVKRSDVWVVTTVIRPKAHTTWGSFKTSTNTNAEVVAFLSDAGLSLLGQVHTHPGKFVDHSEGDDEGAFMRTENYISIVVPNYGRQGMLPLGRCGVHRYERGRFRRLLGAELETAICIVPLAQDFAR